ncbi:hypothetical protein ABVK25_001825 [Lepraria finkii]|uniref:GH18 domain-containing protein n=1 Tax=Lepraria finkii TaxID=1340010 RepID=A0ABR4BK70_9LECA
MLKPANWDTFVSSLRGNFKSDSSMTYYISAAPQRPIPDASIPLDAMLNIDYVWVQIYNNGDRNVEASGFLASMTNWSKKSRRRKWGWTETPKWGAGV